MTRANVDQKLSALLAAEERLHRALEDALNVGRSPMPTARPSMKITRLSMPGGTAPRA
jgi:hypothetical protein